MDKSLYLSMTGAKEAMLAQTAHANNLANARTTGFKADFAQARAMAVLGEGYQSRVYAMTERPSTDFSAATLNQTGRDLDVAIKNDGWFAVQAADGAEAYTRAGELQISADGALRTGTGLPVLGAGGPIVLPPSSKVDIGEDGTISVRAIGAEPSELAVVDQLKLVNPDVQNMVKGQDGLMRLQDGTIAPVDETVQVAQGFVETSNVNAVSELTSMLDLARRFELNLKMMKTAEDNAQSSAQILQNLG